MAMLIVIPVILLVVVVAIIARNQKPADPACSECGGKGIVKTVDFNDQPCYDWCDCTYKNK
jgi:hypothetical protein